MGIKRRFSQGYTVVPDRVLSDMAISFTAAGLYAFLLTFEDGWEISDEVVCQRGDISEIQLKGLLAELRAAGHLSRYHGVYEVSE